MTALIEIFSETSLKAGQMGNIEEEAKDTMVDPRCCETGMQRTM